MKKLVYTALLALLVFAGCKKDDEFLKETPGDFLTLDNAFLNFAQFKTALNELYRQVRLNYDNRDSGDDFFHFGSGTENIFVPVPASAPWTDWSLINPTRGIFNDVFSRHYQLIYHANNILAQSENPEVKMTDAERLTVQAEARFFRAYAYRYLSFLFGGVPIIDEPVTKPRLDYTRNTRAEVYAFCVEDLKFASDNLPKTTSEAGRLVKAAADHQLAEMYIALGDETKDASLYTKSIEAATRVIDGTDGDYHLMTQRFGWRKSVAGKNVFWDMFQMKSTTSQSNYNYQTGNKEAIWVMQVDKYLTGGLNSTMPRTDQERAFWPSFWALEKFGYSGPARDWMGRGISMVRPTDYFNFYLWNNSGSNDMRNDPTNIQRVFYAPDPIIGGKEVPGYDTVYKTNVTLFNGSKIVVELRPGDPIKPEWLTSRQDTMERVFPRVMKMGSDWHYNGDPSNGFVQESYAMRLAETYLIRAEAYMKAGDKIKAADDINAVRNRAGAIPVTPAEVNIDYILDERIRELFGEELHTLTLTRLGLLYDRTKRFGQETSRQTVSEKNNLMPIPQAVIDANSLADFPQNPGYN
jgi:starch-binding outer membrane protein, SusD/RagB family